MFIDDILGMDVIDSVGQNIGKLDDVFFDDQDGTLKVISVKLKKGFLSKEVEQIQYSDIKGIRDVVLLDIELKL